MFVRAMPTAKVTRRMFFSRMAQIGLAAPVLLAAGRARSTDNPAAPTPILTPILTEDGLHRQPWFLESFLELPDDLLMAAEAGKRFAIMWELKGCPYCKETHFVNFADPAINLYIRERFDILQLNIIGSKIVTDFDGEELSEKALAAKYGVRFTPSIQFFPTSVAGLAEQAPKDREVARAQGYLKPPHFQAMFRYVADEAYETESLRSFLKNHQS